MRRICQLLTWLHYGRHYEADLLPFRLLWVPPHQISRYPQEKPSIERWVASGVVSGTWDQHLDRFENGIVFRSLRLRFIEERDWKDTPYHRFALNRIEETGSYKGYTTREGLKQRYEQLDGLFEEIAEQGYRTQQELDLSGSHRVHRHLSLPPEMREVTVDISRRGQFLWWGGAHRLAIAKLLELDEIPVRIRVRHEKWQRSRDQELSSWAGHHPGTCLDRHPDLPI